MTGSLVHALLAGPPPRGHAQEALLHGLLAAVHLHIVARAPRLAGLGTELARRQNSLALSLLNSRPAGSAGIRLIAPDGPGTIPGGAPAMQTPDFWSIPFAPAQPSSAPAPEPLRAVLRRLIGPVPALDGPLAYDEALARLITPTSTTAGCRPPTASAPAGRSRLSDSGGYSMRPNSVAASQ